MTKQLSADAEAYDKEYDAFLKQLEDFHQQRGTSFKRLPRINGKGIDLYLLYVVVTARGGWQKVNSRTEWDDILEDFRLPASCVNSSTALKHIYIRYLDAYERINFLGEEGDERNNDADDDDSRPGRSRRHVRTLNIVPLVYNQTQHNVTETARTGCGMSTDVFKTSSYDRLALSLSCPLPNEHDFAFNMCTLLSNEGKHTLQLTQCSRLIEFMLAHTGVFRDKETQKYFISNYKEAKGKSLVQFWIDSVEDKSVLDLLSPECYDSVVDSGLDQTINNERTLHSNHSFTEPVSEDNSNSEAESPPVETVESSEYADSRNEDQRGSSDNSSDLPALFRSSKEKKDVISRKLEQVLACEGVDLRLEPEDTEIFHLGRDLGLLDSEGTRISQVLHILRNLSFEEINVSTLAQSSTCLRFLVLCVCSRWGGLAVGALDALGNIAAEIILRDPAVDPASALLITTICQGVSSQDRAFVLRSLEVLNKLAVNDLNEEILSCNIEQSVYNQVCCYLTIHDIMLLIYTLESLYSLSSLGTMACNSIVRAKGCVQTLVSLLTVEAQSYGPEACIGMKVVETVTGVVSESESSGSSVPTAASNSASAVATPSSGVVVTNSTVNLPALTPASVTLPMVQTPIKVAPKPLMEPKRITPRIVPPEVEEFVVDWVTRNYEACSYNAMEQAIVYRHFAASMHALGRKQGLNPVLLSNCVRKVFGTGVGPSRRPVEDGSEKWHYNGIKRRDGVLVPAVPDRKIFQPNITCSPHLTPTPIIPAACAPVVINPSSMVIQSSPKMETVLSKSAPGSILKAHLSAPLRNSPSPVRTAPPQHQGVLGGGSLQQPPSTPPAPYSGIPPSQGSHLAATTPQQQQQQQPIPRSDNSALIKSLLASKVSRNIQKQNGPTESIQENSTDAQSAKTVVYNGMKEECHSEGKIVTSFEGILQNGIKEEIIKEETPVEGQIEKRNLLADLLERTVGGDILNGVVDKDLRISERGIHIVSHKVNGPISSNGQTDTSHGIKRPSTPDVSNPVKKLAVEDSRPGSDSRITLYVSQNGSDGEVLSQGHQVILNQGQQHHLVSAGAQLVNAQTVVTPQGQVIIQRPPSQGNVIVQQAPHIISQASNSQMIAQRTPQVISHTSAGQIFSSGNSSPIFTHTSSGQAQVISSPLTQVLAQNSGQMIHQVIAHGQGGQKVIIHPSQLSQVLGGQVLLPQGGGQSIVVQGGGNLPGQVIMQSVAAGTQSPVIVQGAGGHGQVLVHGSGNQAQVLLQSNNPQGQLVMSSANQGQAIVTSNSQHNPVVVTNSNGQTMLVAGNQGQVVVSGSAQGNQGQMVMQSGGAVGNTVFLTPQQASQPGQKTLIILPNPKLMVAGGNQSSGQVVLPRQVVQMVSSSNTVTAPSNPTIRTVRSVSSVAESSSNVYSSNPSSLSSSAVAVAPPPTGPTATPVTQVTVSTATTHIPAPQVLSSGVARRTNKTGLQYICEWRGCNLVFCSPSQVYHHACKIHCPPHITELTCQWSGCDPMVRKRFSAMTHIHDRHCNEQLLQVLALRRQQISLSGKTDVPVPQAPPPHPGYAPNAAFHAIKRHALEVITQRDAVEKEGPVTKSIRLTSALILRNLVIYSHMGKKLLQGYESDLANVAISSMESSRTVSQILYDIHLPDHQAL